MLPGLRGRTVAVALLLATLSSACGDSDEETSGQDASGGQEFQYTATEVTAMVDSWPSGWPGAGEVSTALIAVCQGADRSGDVDIHPFEATPLEAGRWRVTTTCDYTDAAGEAGSFSFEWTFIEDGPRLEASGGRAADVTGQ